MGADSSGRVYSSSQNYQVVARLPGDGSTIVAGKGTEQSGGFSGDGGAANNAKLNSPRGIAFDASDNLIIADSGNK